MSKKKHAHAEHVNHERWLVSYADFITLLFAFFVVLFSSSQVDRSKTNKMSLAIEAAFSRFSLFKDQAGELNLMGSNGKVASTRKSVITSEDGNPIFMAPEVIEEEQDARRYNLGPAELSENVGIPADMAKAMQRAQRDLSQLLDNNVLEGKANLAWDARGLVVSVRDAALFAAGGDELTAESKAVLTNIARVIARVPNQVRIEGHTDNQQPGPPYASNWALSAARAIHVLEWLVADHQVDPSRLIAVGYGEHRPVANNGDEVGRVQNRRVDIVILSEQAAEKEAPRKAPDAKPTPRTPDPFSAQEHPKKTAQLR